jgi:hypothetical protein
LPGALRRPVRPAAVHRGEPMKARPTTKSLIPYPITWEANERFHHRDLVDMDLDSACSEAMRVKDKIARLTCSGQRKDILYADGRETVYTLDWLNERLGLLNAVILQKAVS